MKFTDESVKVIEGPIQTREKQYREEGFFKIASYHAIAHDLEAIARMDPDLVILDEAQRNERTPEQAPRYRSFCKVVDCMRVHTHAREKKDTQ
jgi:hypothetical protein